jgi:hypothetical protein
MKLLDRLERKFGEFPAINFTFYLIFGQIFVFFLMHFYPIYQNTFDLQGNLLMKGEYYRAFSFLLKPIVNDFFFAVFTWYLYYMYGVALERYWGSFKYLIYILIITIATITLALLYPDQQFSNEYVFGSIFLAFAYLFPEFELRLFFIIPVKVKWWALAVWIVMLGVVLLGSMPQKVQTLLSVLNFFIFFYEELWDEVQRRLRRSSIKVKETVSSRIPQHVCNVCGKNNIDNPDMGIRYCSKCKPEKCFCEDDFLKHAHIHASVVN